jgi:hypothetical protein
MPDGRWLEKPYKNPYTGEWVSRWRFNGKLS